MFAKANCTHAIIFEDDLMLAPDALDYLYSTLHFLSDANTSRVVAASAWNDNGHAVNLPEEATLTSFFPGLGWVLSRPMWKALAPTWPESVTARHPAPVVTGWDYWLRIQFFKNNWYTVIPSIPRTKHISIGTNVNHEQNANLYSTTTLSNAASGTIDWITILKRLVDVETFSSATQSRLTSGPVLKSVDDALRYQGTANNLVLPYTRHNYEDLASKLGLWPTPRGHFHYTMLVTVPGTNVTMLIYDQIQASAFFTLPTTSAAVSVIPRVTHVVASLNQSCDAACDTVGLICTPLALETTNNCEMLQTIFKKTQCKSCTFETGRDLPAAVDIHAPIETAGSCLITERGVGPNGSLDCTGSFPWTRRACGCVAIGDISGGHDEL